MPLGNIVCVKKNWILYILLICFKRVIGALLAAAGDYRAFRGRLLSKSCVAVSALGGVSAAAQAADGDKLAFAYQASGALMLFALERTDKQGGTVRVIAQAAPGSSDWSATIATVLEGVSSIAVVRYLAAAPMG